MIDDNFQILQDKIDCTKEYSIDDLKTNITSEDATK